MSEYLRGFIEGKLEGKFWSDEKIKIICQHRDELGKEVTVLADKNDRLQQTLAQIKNWCAAYPIDMFHEPDWREVKEKLGSPLLSAVSAANMRHVTTGIQKIIDSTMGEKHED